MSESKMESIRAYELIQLRLADYSLGLGAAIRGLCGDGALRGIIRRSAETSAGQKVESLKGLPTEMRPKAMAQRLVSMLNEFGTQKISTRESAAGDAMVVNPRCGCLPPFTSQAEIYNFSPQEAREYACMRCMPGYSRAAQLLDIGFYGRYTERGCVMEFLKSSKSNLTPRQTQTE